MSEIVHARLLEVAVPLKTAFAISGGAMAVRRSLVVALEDRDGLVGYGESAPFERPFYSSETLASVCVSLRDLMIPRVLGRAFPDSAALHVALDEGIRGHHFARAGVETAWWDLEARRRETSLANLVAERLAALGVPPEHRRMTGSVVCGVALGIPPEGDPDRLRDEVRDAVRAGFQRVKLKVRPGWSTEPVRLAREVLAELGTDLPLWVDGNGAFDPEQDAEELVRLRAEPILFVEQPFAPDGWWDSAVVNRQPGAPICLDETLSSDSVARQVLDMGGPAIWNLKVQRLGGLEETCRVYARGIRAGVRLWVGTMPETGLGAQAALAVAGLSGVAYPTDIEPSDRWFEEGTDLVTLRMNADGRIAVPDECPDPDLGTARIRWESPLPNP